MNEKSIEAGLAGDKIARAVTGSNEVSAPRSAIATATGTGLGYAAGSGAVIGLKALGATALAVKAAPVVVPVAVCAGIVAFVRSRFP